MCGNGAGMNMRKTRKNLLLAHSEYSEEEAGEMVLIPLGMHIVDGILLHIATGTEAYACAEPFINIAVIKPFLI